MIISILDSDAEGFLEVLYQAACKDLATAYRQHQFVVNLRRNYNRGIDIATVMYHPHIVKPGSPQWREIPQNTAE